MKKLTVFLTLTLLPFMAAAQSGAEIADTPFTVAIKEAMAAEIRTEVEKDRDDNRMPAETLAFFGINESMRVLELVPGGGWYTKLLAPALHENGQLYVVLAGGLKRNGLLKQPGFENVVLLDPKIEVTSPPDANLFGFKPLDLGVSGLDAALTFRNLHNLNTEGRASTNLAVFDALKPGGIYGVVDHTRRHMEPDSPENNRRVDPLLMIQEIQAAGFEFIDFSNLHYRADDELRYEVGRKTVKGNTDRFTLLFRKPG